MSGPLQRLAHRLSLKTTPHRVHPMARLPYAKPPDLQIETSADATGQPLSSAQSTEIPEAAADRRDPNIQPQPFPATVDGSVNKSRSTTSSTAADHAPEPVLGTDGSRAAEIALPARHVEPHGASQSAGMAERTKHAAHSPAPVGSDLSGDGERVSAALPAADLPGTGGGAVATGHSAGPLDDLPVPIVTEQGLAASPDAMVATPAKAAAASSLDPERAARHEAGPTDEIHIHIGRIEVTAVRESDSPTPRRKRKGREPLSLDDYLTRRRQSE